MVISALRGASTRLRKGGCAATPHAYIRSLPVDVLDAYGIGRETVGSLARGLRYVPLRRGEAPPSSDPSAPTGVDP